MHLLLIVMSSIGILFCCQNESKEYAVLRSLLTKANHCVSIDRLNNELLKKALSFDMTLMQIYLSSKI